VSLAHGAGAVATSAAAGSDPVLLLAGDIAMCDSSFDEATAAILDAHPTTSIQTLGDNVYENGTEAEFANCYEPSWGRHKARTRPAAGNHDYNTPNASGYYGYFGAAAGNPSEGWYSYDLGSWHIVVLNTNCSPVGGCQAGSPQEQWLRADLAAHPAPCTLAVMHEPRFGSILSHPNMQPIWQALADFRVDVVMSGDQHNYERFTKLNAAGSPDPEGMRSFIVGTGGASLSRFGSAVAPGSEVRDDRTYGVMKLTLRPQSYDWEFIPRAGQTFTDSGAESCRGDDIDGTPPTAPANLSATTAPGRVDLSWEASTDNVGVAGYDVLRNGATLATVGVVTSYSDTTVQPGTTYTYTVRARDAAGNPSPASNAVTVTTPSPAATTTFAPVADTRAQESNPTTNYGSASTLGTDGSPRIETYIRFDVSGTSGTVTSARLRLYATNASVDGPSVRTTSNTWTESGLTWSNRPAPIGAPTDDRGVIPANAYTEWDVTPSVTGNGTISFVLAQLGDDGSSYSSRQASTNRPQLVVTYEPTPAEEDTTPPSQPNGLTAAPGQGRVDLTWQPAADNVAVTGYEIFRNGSVLASVGAVTSYIDTSVAPETHYTYEVRAFDAAGNNSPLSDAVSVTTPEPGETVLTFNPVADARVQEANPTTNIGTSTSLRTRAGPIIESNLRFDLGVLPGGVITSAKLRLNVTATTVDGPAVYRTDTAWTETGITWSNRPARTSGASDDRGALPLGYAEWDVTPLIPPSGAVAFVLAQPGSDQADYSAREASSNKPELVITIGSPPPADTTAPSKPTGLMATAVGGRVDLRWNAATDNVGVTGYDIFRNGSLLASVGAVTTYADTTVAPATLYTYTVRARDAANNVSPESDPAVVTTPLLDTTPPSTATGLAANAVSGRVDLSWQAATDDVGVTGYEIYRNGSLRASVGEVTSFADTTVAPSTEYTYTVRARDAANNVSGHSDPAVVTTPAAPQTLTFGAVADADVTSATPSTNYGTAVVFGTDASPSVEAYITFDVSGLSGTIQSAKLRLYATNGSVDGPAVYKTESSWSETTLTWSNRPARISAASDDRLAVTKSAWNEWNVTPLVTGNGAVSFVLAQPGTDGTDFHSRQASSVDLRPQLVVTTAP
jgi:chitodextrinase